MTKFEIIDSIAVSMVQKALLDVVQSILEQADSLHIINERARKIYTEKVKKL